MAGKNQNKATLRGKMRSALAKKSLADALLDSLVSMENKWNATLTKLNADTPGALDTNYSALGAIPASGLISETASTLGQNKASLKKALESALSHRKLADDILDSMVELQVSYNALLLKLDAEAGTLNDSNYASLLSVHPLVAASPSSRPAQHKASIRKSLRSAIANESAADALLDAIIALQTKVNAALVQLDLHLITGLMTAFQVSVLDPNSRS